MLKQPPRVIDRVRQVALDCKWCAFEGYCQVPEPCFEIVVLAIDGVRDASQHLIVAVSREGLQVGESLRRRRRPISAEARTSRVDTPEQWITSWCGCQSMLSQTSLIAASLVVTNTRSASCATSAALFTTSMLGMTLR